MSPPPILQCELRAVAVNLLFVLGQKYPISQAREMFLRYFVSRQLCHQVDALPLEFRGLVRMLHEKPSGVCPVHLNEGVRRPAVLLADLAEALRVFCIDLAERIGELLEFGLLSRVQRCLISEFATAESCKMTDFQWWPNWMQSHSQPASFLLPRSTGRCVEDLY